MKPYRSTFREVDMPAASKVKDVRLCCYSIIILIILTATPLHVSMDSKELVSACNDSMNNSV
jgi:hypothetical protein